MRKRMIDPGFWSDEKIGNLSAQARLLFIASWNIADDEGILPFRSEFLRSTVFTYDNYSIEVVQKWTQELINQNLVFPYTINGQSYAIILNFLKHQVINKPQPSKLPKPSIQNREYLRSIFKRDGFICQLCGEHTSVEKELDGKDRTPSIDHIIPKSKGGGDMPSNLQTVCLSCNKGRSNRSLPEYYGRTTGTVSPKRIEEKGREDKRSISGYS